MVARLRGLQQIGDPWPSGDSLESRPHCDLTDIEAAIDEKLG
jgi:hypothetical protein